MQPTKYDLLTVDERYAFLHRVFDRALDELVADDYDLPTPGQVAHADFENLHRCYRIAILAESERK